MSAEFENDVEVDLRCEVCGGGERPFLVSADLRRCAKHLPPWPGRPSPIHAYRHRQVMPELRRDSIPELRRDSILRERWARTAQHRGGPARQPTSPAQ